MAKFIKVPSATAGGQDVVLNVDNVTWMQKAETAGHTRIRFIGDSLTTEALEVNLSYSELQIAVTTAAFP